LSEFLYTVSYSFSSSIATTAGPISYRFWMAISVENRKFFKLPVLNAPDEGGTG